MFFEDLREVVLVVETQRLSDLADGQRARAKKFLRAVQSQSKVILIGREPGPLAKDTTEMVVRQTERLSKLTEVGGPIQNAFQRLFRVANQAPARFQRLLLSAKGRGQTEDLQHVRGSQFSVTERFRLKAIQE